MVPGILPAFIHPDAGREYLTPERYLVIEGEGRAIVGGVEADVRPGDVVVIPAGVSQQIVNCGARDLVFYCICSPRFTPECYEAL